MGKHRVCPVCGCNIDYGEKCRCEEDEREEARIRQIHANDIVLLRETGEVFKVLGINYERRLIIPEDDINIRYKTEEAELLESCGEMQTYEQTDRLRRHGCISYIEKGREI